MDTLLAAMLESPLLPRQLKVLNEAMREERKRRERFYEEMTPDQKVEFINGYPVLHSPARWQHTKALSYLAALLTAHVNRHELGDVGIEKVLVSLSRNDYEPDITFFAKEKSAAFHAEQMIFPAPDLAVEVLSPSTERLDRQEKKEDYAQHGVTEYWIIAPASRTVEQYALTDGSYQLLGAWRAEDHIASVAVPGFRIPVLAIFEAGENAKTLSALLS